MHAFDTYHTLWFPIYCLSGILLILLLIISPQSSFFPVGYILFTLLLICGALLRYRSSRGNKEFFLSKGVQGPETGEFAAELICGVILGIHFALTPSIVLNLVNLILLVRFSLGLLLRIFPLRIEYSVGQRIFRAFSWAFPLMTVLAAVLFPNSGYLLLIMAWLSAIMRLCAHIQEILLRRHRLHDLLNNHGLQGLWRSYFIYHCIPFRYLQSWNFYHTIIGHGSIVWDIGAHLGNRSRVWLNLGADVTAFEPHPACAALLENWFGSCPRFNLRRCALGSEAGEKILYLSDVHPTLSSVSADWVSRMEKHPRFERIKWNRQLRIEIVSAESEVRRRRLPEFVKIDVEGSERDVLEGFKELPRALCFEFLPADRQNAFGCISFLESRHQWHWNYVIGECFRYVFPQSVSRAELFEYLAGIGDDHPSGDVYAYR